MKIRVNKVDKIKRKWMRSSLKNMINMLVLIQKMGIPKDDEEKELLKNCVKCYDDTLAKIDKEFFLYKYRKNNN